jgi:hypothetical protein
VGEIVSLVLTAVMVAVAFVWLLQWKLFSEKQKANKEKKGRKEERTNKKEGAKKWRQGSEKVLDHCTMSTARLLSDKTTTFFRRLQRSREKKTQESEC